MHQTLRILKDGGCFLLIHKVIHKLTGSFLQFGRVTFFKRELGESIPLPPSAAALALRQARPAETEELHKQRDPSRPADFLTERFRRGDRCFVALGEGDRLVHSRWVTSRRAYVRELGLDVILEPGQAYMYDGYTTPAHRGHGVDGAVRCFIFETMRAAGCKAVYSYVQNDNPAAMKAARKWQKPIGTLWYLRFGRFAPIIAGPGQLDGLHFVRPLLGCSDELESADRTAVSRAWFEGWLKQPMTRRSTGCDARPTEYFESTASYIAGALSLDPRRDVVLDVGCDSALVSRFVARRCRALVGVDLIPGMLADVPKDTVRSASERRAVFVASDGRFLPFRSQVFTKAYCCAVLHVLPSRNDGLALIHELIRVCRPGGQILIASVPDARKRVTSWLDVFIHSRPKDKLKTIGALVLPRTLRRDLRRRLGIPAPDYPIALDYSLARIGHDLEALGLDCTTESFPAHYWCRDFRKTRSNLLIRIPLQPADGRTGLPEVQPASHHTTSLA